MKHLLNGFTIFARWTANASGNALTFIVALLAVVIWGALGPKFGYSDTWQLVIIPPRK